MNLYDLFITFIFTSHKYQRINHNDGWCGCAVGDFAREQSLDAEKIQDDLAEGNPRLLSALNSAGSTFYSTDADLSTYGKLQEYILGQESITEEEHDGELAMYRA